ncbi:DUF2975 domain-containing protein [Mesonia maritima]|uniref:Glucan phosphoethanolaminetransferase (Alkaline phosphatase superfamily) n=1 Tax=Mesonia maritima TaxID=1793873 RepID=A0ABU1K1U0_9FLAO|nr:DUF2975 domain-containing protein [Mesonia maritima]MDR6299574.1 glucan phosphoethanolaminetransferase (alkaline phosphatase superfamily) [Mesonia maritima]
MKVLHILRFLISLLFTMYSLTYIGLFLICNYIIFIKHEIPEFLNLKINRVTIINTSEISEPGKVASFFISYFIILALTLGSLFFLKKFVYDIKPRRVFTSKQTFYLKRIGQCIIGATVTKFLFSIFYSIFFNNVNKDFNAEFGLEATDLFGNEYYIIGVGLFFLFLSKLFSIAQRQKEENELTI